MGMIWRVHVFSIHIGTWPNPDGLTVISDVLMKNEKAEVSWASYPVGLRADILSGWQLSF